MDKDLMNISEPGTDNKYETVIKAAKEAIEKIDEIYIEHLLTVRTTDSNAYNRACALLKPDLLRKLNQKIAGDL